MLFPHVSAYHKIYVYAGWENNKKIGTIYSDILNGSEVISFEREAFTGAYSYFRVNKITGETIMPQNNIIIPYFGALSAFIDG